MIWCWRQITEMALQLELSRYHFHKDYFIVWCTFSLSWIPCNAARSPEVLGLQRNPTLERRFPQIVSRLWYKFSAEVASSLHFWSFPLFRRCSSRLRLHYLLQNKWSSGVFSQIKWVRTWKPSWRQRRMNNGGGISRESQMRGARDGWLTQNDFWEEKAPP